MNLPSSAILDPFDRILVAETRVEKLALITKGDLLSQETKIARSGLADYFAYIEIVSEKPPATYETILNRYQIAPERFLMIGNSMRSDVLPVVEIGGVGVHLPYHVTWEHEEVSEEVSQHERLFILESLLDLPELVDGLGVA